MTDLLSTLNQLSIPPEIKTKKVKGRKANVAQRDVRAYIRDLFKRNGLPESLANWAYGVLVEGASGTEMVQRMYQRPEFKVRFKALFQFQKNFPQAPAISPADVLNFEAEAMQRMRAAGFPPQFYDSFNDFVPLISNGVSMAEFASRIEDGFERVHTAPRAVRNAFARFFGPSGDAALAAMFLDPRKALPTLRRQVRAAETAGAGFNFGFTLDRDTALEIADAGFDFQQAQDRFANLAQQAPLFQETVAEEQLGEDLDELEEGVEAVFGLEGAGAALQATERRRGQRQAAFSGGGGAIGSPQTGASGLGASRT